MTSKSTKLSNMVAEIISGLDKKSIETVMAGWNSKKKEIAKLLGEGARSSKRQKDPNAPKKPNTSYIIFCGEHRDKVRKENPTLTNIQVTSRLGEMWKNCKDRKKYEEAAEQEKKRYESEMAGYTHPPTVEGDETVRGREKKERTGPKRPLTAYMYFCQENRDVVKTKHPNMNGKEITTELGLRWKALTEQEKAPYEAKQSADKTRYEQEKTGTSSVVPAKSPKVSDKEDKKKDTESTKPKANKNTKSKVKENGKGYNFFITEQTEELQSEHPEWSSRKITAELAKRWKELTDEERDDYEQEATLEEADEVELEDE